MLILFKWQMKPTTEKTGSGFILPDRKILTNAHVCLSVNPEVLMLLLPQVIADHTFITVKKFGETQKYTAKVIGVGHDCDLALLAVTDDEFWADDTAALELGDIPV